MNTFTERTEYTIEVVPPFSIINCKRSDILEKDGVEISKTYHRHCRVPGEDVSEDCEELQKVAEALWTPELISKYQDYVNKQREQLKSVDPSKSLNT